jgi:hypothetical protein
MQKLFTFFVCAYCCMAGVDAQAQYGKATGLLASFHYATMPNRDDLDADARLDYATTFRYGGGIEKLNFFANNFGTGFQLNFWQAGQNYTGIADTFSKSTFKAATTLSYAKGSFLIHYRSWNRYNPQTRFRFTSYLGPYVSALVTFKDKIDLFDAAGNDIGGYSFTPLGKRGKTNSLADVDLKSPIYKFVDYGFIVAPGIQYMLTKKFALAFHIRADISAVNVEATGNLTQKVANPPYEKDFDLWGNLYAKYLPYDQYQPGLKKPLYDERSTTKNLTIGAQLTARWYVNEQY